MKFISIILSFAISACAMAAPDAMPEAVPEARPLVKRACWTAFAACKADMEDVLILPVVRPSITGFVQIGHQSWCRANATCSYNQVDIMLGKVNIGLSDSFQYLSFNVRYLAVSSQNAPALAFCRITYIALGRAAYLGFPRLVMATDVKEAAARSRPTMNKHAMSAHLFI
ncbi:hypothetical protein BST61_g2757 [Cercospora zeina]